jgi:glycosyltransferase involved in cell wall biosynthesis
MLNWSLVVCTLNRQKVLEASLRTVISQTRLPKQIIIVDASDNWEASKNSIFNTLVRESESIQWIYVGSERKSSSYQRNRGLEYCESEVVFYLDDDSFMYSDCAEEIMEVYEKDEAGIVGGVSTLLANQMPTSELANKTNDETETAPPPEIKRNILLEYFIKLWDQPELFIPYDGKFYTHDISELAQRTSIFSDILFHGCRMTFRTSIVRELGGFEEGLIKNALGEDSDLSYRVSRKYALVIASKAKLFHLYTEVSRISRYTNSVIIILNSAFLFLVNTPPTFGSKLVIYRFAIKRLFLELIRDLTKPKRGFPHSRGTLKAVLSLHKMFNQDKSQLRSWYQDFQADIYSHK